MVFVWIVCILLFVLGLVIFRELMVFLVVIFGRYFCFKVFELYCLMYGFIIFECMDIFGELVKVLDIFLINNVLNEKLRLLFL